MKIGALRHRILFQSEEKISDDAHGHTSIWNDVAVTWADIEPLAGRELYYAQQIKNTISHKITIRYREDINEEMRIIFGIRIFKIESIINIKEQKKLLLLRCEEKRKIK